MIAWTLADLIASLLPVCSTVQDETQGKIIKQHLPTALLSNLNSRNKCNIFRILLRHKNNIHLFGKLVWWKHENIGKQHGSLENAIEQQSLLFKLAYNHRTFPTPCPFFTAPVAVVTTQAWCVLMFMAFFLRSRQAKPGERDGPIWRLMPRSFPAKKMKTQTPSRKTPQERR